MKNYSDITKVIISFLSGGIGFVFGGLDALLIALIACIVIDYITGLLSAFVTHSLDSKIGFKGIAKKIIILAIVALANIIDTHFKLNTALRSLTCMFYIVNEALSILENAVVLDVPIPRKLKTFLAQINDEIESEDE